jgi:lactate dehydrogenase-like 2-hydroxyacid dehydrogenase
MASKGVIYCNAAPACTESVADATIWLLLNTFRDFSWSSRGAHSLDVDQFNDANRNIAAVTHNPNGHTLGIIGMGKIGYRVAQKAYGSFDMKIIYNDIVQISPSIENSIDARFFRNLDHMLEEADCVVLATPFSGEIVMTAAKFSKMKRGSRFINVARGKLVDEDALLAALKSGRIIAAGLDVHFDEPHVNPKLAKLSNVQLLSHTAGSSIESHVGFEKLGMENILQFFETGKALTPVNLHWMDTSGYKI